LIYSKKALIVKASNRVLVLFPYWTVAEGVSVAIHTQGFELFVIRSLNILLARDMKKLECVIILADVCIFIGFIIVLYICISKVDIAPTSSRYLTLMGNKESFFLFFGMAIYSLEGIGLVLPIETSMKDRKQYKPTLLISLLVASIFYLSLGFFGYIGWGKDT